MEEYQHKQPRGRRLVRIVRRGWRAGAALVAMLWDIVRDDIALIAQHMRLCVGLALTAIGLLSFTSDRYCDGNSSSYYACTRPSTYYYYPWWAIILTVLGGTLIVLWWLRRQSRP